MIYNRGQRADFDNWAQRGNRGWGYVDVLPYFKRTERRIGIGDDRIHGRAGDLPVTDMDWFHPVCDAFMEGAQELGIPRCEDYNSGDRQAGVGYFQRLINRGYRHSAARVFLHPARRGGQLDVRTDARASRILFDGTRAKACVMSMTATVPRCSAGVRPQGGDRFQRYRQYRETAANFRRRTGGVVAGTWRAGRGRSAGGGEFPRSLLGAHRRAGEEHPDHQRNVAKASVSPVRSPAGHWANRRSWRSVRRWCTGSGSPRTRCDTARSARRVLARPAISRDLSDCWTIIPG